MSGAFNQRQYGKRVPKVLPTFEYYFYITFTFNCYMKEEIRSQLQVIGSEQNFASGY